jgi:multidrug efflux pump
MGVVIASGMTIGTAFTLFVLPAFYLYLAQDHSKAHAEAKNDDAEPSLPTATQTPH